MSKFVWGFFGIFKVILIFAVITFSSCAHQKKTVAKKSTPPPLTYSRFINALNQLDVEKVNALLDFRCEFKQYPGMKNWYAFYRNAKLMIGPFPLNNYKNASTLGLTRPAGYRKNDFSRFHVFSQNYDLYLYFGPERVWIEGSGASGSKSAKVFVY